MDVEDVVEEEEEEDLVREERVEENRAMRYGSSLGSHP